MIGWLQSVDVSLFRFINLSLSNSFFDKAMPFVSDPPWFIGLMLLLAVVAVWKGGARGRVCVLMLALSLCIGNWLVCDSIKHGVGRLRPFHVIHDAILRVGMGDSMSMPSSHAANWAGLLMVLLIYYRRTIWITLPATLIVGFSRVYVGVHYPSDVLAGWLLGAGYTAAVIWLTQALWQWLGPHWFPLWWEQLPSLIQPVVVPTQPSTPASQALRDAQWLRLGYLLTIFLCLVRLAYLASGRLELSEDEAYQWLWSKHLALSYYSKPPLIAYTQFLGTHLFGDNEMGVRFFSPILAAILSILILRFMTREVSGRAAFILFLILCATPLTALGAIVMTVDPLSVLFWTAAMIVGWRAMQPSGTTRKWIWVGVWMGLGLLSKYTNLVQFVSWIFFFLLWPPARRHLRKPGPYLALLIVVLFSIPIVIWNMQHRWITAVHVASDGQLGEPWHRFYISEFLLVETGVLHPIFFWAALWAAVAFWRRGRHDPWQLFLFSMGAPIFLMYFGLSFHSRILANWIAPSIVPLFCLMVTYWRARWQAGASFVKPVLVFGLGLGIFVVVLAHNTNLVTKLIHRQLPAQLDVLHRVRGWKELAAIVGQAREREQEKGPPAFIICEHYGFTSQISFYLPEAKKRVSTDPLVFFFSSPRPINQFYFWPSYLDRTGQNAIYAREVEKPRLRPDWFQRWWHHDDDLFLKTPPPFKPLPTEVVQQFQSIHDLGVRNVVVNGSIVRRVQLFECQNLR